MPWLTVAAIFVGFAAGMVVVAVLGRKDKVFAEWAFKGAFGLVFAAGFTLLLGVLKTIATWRELWSQ